jgi:hypothetical protein
MCVWFRRNPSFPVPKGSLERLMGGTSIDHGKKAQRPESSTRETTSHPINSEDQEGSRQ